jgi:anti-sigma factor RsiW
MTDESAHLTEAERQTLADGSLPAKRAREVQAHLRGCEPCAMDVARLRLIARRYSQPLPLDPPLAELWPAIRSRIEQSKVVPLAPPAAAPRPRWVTSRSAAVAGLGASAAIAMAAIVVTVWLRPSRSAAPSGAGLEATRDSAQALTLVADSVRSYQEEARVLLDRLELQRAMIRPEAMASIDRDLKVIDQAIEELEVAIERDPRNPALRQLLASSYRQKVELLKRAGNAG